MRVVLVAGVYNVADVVEPFCRYHAELGIDLILAAEYGSTDGTREVLNELARTLPIRIVPLPTHRFKDYDPSNVLFALAREEFGADWVAFLDTDEFLVTDKDLKAVLSSYSVETALALKVRRRNMTGAGEPADGRFLDHLRYRIVCPQPFEDQQWVEANPRIPWIFTYAPPKVIARARKELSIGLGDHDVSEAHWLKVPVPLAMQILHYPIRSLEMFRLKVRTGRAYFEKNQDFHQDVAWHWRRWIDIDAAGGLETEYARQFIDAGDVASLSKYGLVAEETRLAEWSARTFGPA